MATLDELTSCVDDPDDDSTRAYLLVDQLVADGDRSLIPALTAQLNLYLDEEHFYGRDVIADVLAGLAGVDALPVLVRASARDLGDDQDTLHATITDLVFTTAAEARPFLNELLEDQDAEVRKAAAWASEYLDELQEPAD